MLCFFGLFRSLLSTTENLYLATGKPQVRTKLNLLQLVLMALLMYPLTMRYGIMGAAIAATLPSVLVVVLTLREAGKIIGESFGFIARTFVPSIMGSLVMVVGIYVWTTIMQICVIILSIYIIVMIYIPENHFIFRFNYFENKNE